MKRQGSTFPLETERNRDLIRVFRNQYLDSDTTDLAFYQHIADSPSSRFWVTEERATLVVQSMLKGIPIDNMLSTKVDMYREIYNRYLRLKALHPEQSISVIISEIINQPAPKFYMTAKSVREIIYRIKRKWYENRKKKLRHLF